METTHRDCWPRTNPVGSEICLPSACLPLLLSLKRSSSSLQWQCPIFLWPKEGSIPSPFRNRNRQLKCPRSDCRTCPCLPLPNENDTLSHQLKRYFIKIMKIAILLLVLVLACSIPTNFDLRVQTQRTKYTTYDLQT